METSRLSDRDPRASWLPSLIGRLRMRTLMLHLTLLLAFVLCSGCASSLQMESKRHLQRFDGGTRPVYVTNPELQREYEILRTSGIYPLSNEREGALLLTLHPSRQRQYRGCATPLVLSILTFGIVPGALPAARAFEYELQTDGTTEICKHHLPLYERFSIWEWLLRRDEQKVLAEALAWSSFQPRSQGAAANADFSGTLQPTGHFPD